MRTVKSVIASEAQGGPRWLGAAWEPSAGSYQILASIKLSLISDLGSKSGSVPDRPVTQSGVPSKFLAVSQTPECLLSDSQCSCDYKSRSSRVARKQIWDLYSTYTKSTSYVTGLPSGWNDYDALSGTLTRGLGNAAARIGYSSPSLQTSCCFPWLAISLSCEQPPALRPQASGRPSSP